MSLELCVVRRIRLKCWVLIIEWTYEETDGIENNNKYFASAFDVFPPINHLAPWMILFRSSWNLQLDGFRTDPRHFFSSDHTSTYYVVYMWQKAMSQNLVPLESLTIWDIRHRATGRTGPPHDENAKPKIINRLFPDDLEFYGIRQRKTVQFWDLEIDGHNPGMVYFEESSHCSMGGRDIDDISRLPRVYRNRITGIPLVGDGPRWEDEVNDPQRWDLSWKAETARKASCWQFSPVYPYHGLQRVVSLSGSITFVTIQWVPRRSGIMITGKD